MKVCPHILVADDGSLKHLMEGHDICEEYQNALLRRHLFPVNISNIGYELEYIKGYPKGKNNVERLHIIKYFSQISEEEIRVFEHTKDSDKYNH